MRNTVVLAVLLQGILSAQDISGDWQGALRFGKNEIRVVITLAERSSGGLTAAKVTPDDGSNTVVASSVSFEGSNLRISFDAIRATCEGILSESKNSFRGTWIQGSPLPLDLDRVTGESSWRRDRTAHKIQFVEVEDHWLKGPLSAVSVSG